MGMSAHPACRSMLEKRYHSSIITDLQRQRENRPNSVTLRVLRLLVSKDSSGSPLMKRMAEVKTSRNGQVSTRRSSSLVTNSGIVEFHQVLSKVAHVLNQFSRVSSVKIARSVSGRHLHWKIDAVSGESYNLCPKFCNPLCSIGASSAFPLADQRDPPQKQSISINHQPPRTHITNIAYPVP